MKHSKKITALMIFLLIGFFVFSGSAYAVTDKTLTVGSGTGNYGDTVAVPITVDNPAGVGGVAFTLTYNSSVFEFQEIVQDVKGISDGSEYLVDGEYTVTEEQKVTVSNTLFYQVNDQPLNNRVLVAGASARELTNTCLFKAKFLIKDDVQGGTHPIGLNRTIILNAAAGYNTASFIPALVGMPAMEANAQGYYDTPVFTTTLVNGSITVHTDGWKISGAVSYEDNGAAADGTPVVLKKLIGSTYVSQAQTTVSGGSYSFADNLADDYRVYVTSNDPNFYNKYEDVTVVDADVIRNVVLPAPQRVSGTVTINSDYLPGLKVKVMNGTQVVGIYAVNSDGTYQSGPLPPLSSGTYTAYAVYGSLTSVELTAGYNWEVTLRTIDGTVSGLTSGAVATITASSADGKMMKTATSDVTDGTYAIPNLVPANDYIVSAVAAGLPVIYFDGRTAFTEADPVDILTLDATANFDYTAVTKGTISGVVYEGTIANTVSDIGVFAFNVDTYSLTSVVTDASGYTLTLLPGFYELFVIKESGTVFYYDAESVGNVNQNEAKADILEVTTTTPVTAEDMDVIECDKTLTGKVTYEVSDGNPVAFALITATSGDKMAGTITGVDGTYALSGLCDGLEYTVEMDPQAGNYGIQTGTITAGTDTTLNFIIDTGHVLSGTVKDSVDPYPGVGNAMIYLRDQETNALVGGRMYFSEADGSYSIRDIPTGIYTLVVSHPLYRTYTEANVAIGADTSKDIPLVQGAHFYGTVLDGSNGDVPLAGVLIIVTCVGGTPVYAVTNSSGAYSVYGLDATMSDYIILAQKRGYVRQVKTIQTPTTDVGTEASFTLAYPAAIFDLSGTITKGAECGGGSVTNALVVVSSATEDFFSSTRTGDNGAYSSQNLPQADDYRFVVVPGGSLQVHVETGLNFTGATTFTKDVTLPCGSEISGAITWTGTSAAYVLLYTADNEFVDFTMVDTSGGTYTFTGLTDVTTYNVLAFAPGNTPKWYDGRAGIDTADPVSAGSPGIIIDMTQ